MATPASFSPLIPQQADACIANLLPRAASRHPTGGLRFASGDAVREGEWVSYPALLRESQQILGGLQARRGPGEKIALLLESPRDFIPAFWACVLGGYIPCPLAPIRSDPDRWMQHLAHVDRLLDRPLYLSAGAALDELSPEAGVADLGELRRGPLQTAVYPAAEISAPAVLMLTSGSTGNSKAVELTNANLIASMQGRARRQQLASNDITFNWIAFDHVAALLESHMIALYVGATQLHAEPAVVLADPLQFLRLIHRHRVSLAFSPNFLLGQINAALQAASIGSSERRALALDLSCLRRIVTGGEANVVDTARCFLELLAPYGLARTALWPAWGMTETCAASIYSHEFPDCDADREFAAVGWPIEGLEIRVLDDDGRECAAGAAGELQVRGPVVFNRYYNNEEATRTAFTQDGWFRTGDVGRIDDGRLRLVARNKDSIIVNGVNYYSHELETKLEQLAGIERSFVAAFPTRPKGADTEQLVVTFATTLPADDEAGIYQLVVAVRNTTIMLWGFRPAIILVLPRDAFPKTSLGKIQRALMRKRHEAGELAGYLERMAEIARRQCGPYRAPDGPLESAIARVFAEILRVDLGAVSATASFFDLGGTSLDILKFTQMLERRFGLKTGLPIVLQNPNARQLAQCISTQGQQRTRSYEPLVALQLSGRKTPLFCVHPGNGEVFVLVNLAKYFLNDRPFYALRPKGFNDGEEHFRSVRQMVETYVAAILQRQSEGPFAIAGYSLGCEVAFEIAKELQARGNQVGFLGCIDSGPRRHASQVAFNMAAALALVTDLVTREQYLQLNSQLGAAPPSDETCAEVLKVASPQRLQELDLDLRKFSLWARVAYANEALLFNNITCGTLPSMTIFCSEGIAPRYSATQWTREAWLAELRCWDEFIVQPRYVAVPGHHHGLMGPKHVAAFQEVLRAEIDAALGGR
jgi:acyl-CoA synthetase (AMP-forming)/AMP-acid ligase II/thioesterase domain-containing protein